MGNRLVIFVVLGRLGNNLCISKLAPVCDIELVSKVYAFRESKGFGYNEKLEYITLPKAITRFKPRFLYRIIRWLFEPVQLLYYAIKIRPDYINGVYTLPKGLNSFIVSKISGIKCIISVIGGKEEIESDIRIPKLWKALNVFMLKHCYAVTCKGKKDIDFLIKNGIDRNKVFIFNGGIDTDRFSNENLPRIYHVIFAGRFDTNKGSLRVLEMIKKIINEIPDIKCVMLGDGELKRSFEKQVVEAGLEKNIFCFGHISNPEIYFRQAKVFVLPSSNEGLSTAMLESMSCGCVPVVSDVGNTSEALKNDVNGFLIEHFRDIDGFVYCVLKLLNDDQTLKRLSHQAVKMVSEQYSYKVQSVFFRSIIGED